MKNSKLFRFVCFACVICLLMLSGCKNKVQKNYDEDGTVTYELYYQHSAVINFENGKITGGTVFDVKGKTVGTFTVEHLKLRKATKLVSADFEGSGTIESAVKVEITIDKNGDITDEIYYDALSAILLDIRYEYKYGKDGNRVSCAAYMDGRKWYDSEYAVSSFGENFLKTKKIYYSYGGYLSGEYNEYGDVVSEVSYYSEDEVNVYNYEYVYDDRGKILKCITCFGGEWYRTDNMTYDDIGRLTSKIIDFSNNSRTEIEYEYDEDGNEYRITKDYKEDENYVEETVNGEYIYFAYYRLDGTKIEEYIFKESAIKSLELKNGRTFPRYYLYQCIFYDEEERKEKETFFVEIDNDDKYSVVNTKEEIVYKGGYSRTVHDYGEDYRLIRVYDEEGTLICEYKLVDVYDSVGILAYRDEYENGELKTRDVYNGEGELMFSNFYVNGVLTVQNVYMRNEFDTNKDGIIWKTRTSDFMELPELD